MYFLLSTLRDKFAWLCGRGWPALFPGSFWRFCVFCEFFRKNKFFEFLTNFDIFKPQNSKFGGETPKFSMLFVGISIRFWRHLNENSENQENRSFGPILEQKHTKSWNPPAKSAAKHDSFIIIMKSPGLDWMPCLYTSAHCLSLAKMRQGLPSTMLLSSSHVGLQLVKALSPILSSSASKSCSESTLCGLWTALGIPKLSSACTAHVTAGSLVFQGNQPIEYHNPSTGRLAIMTRPTQWTSIPAMICHSLRLHQVFLINTCSQEEYKVYHGEHQHAHYSWEFWGSVFFIASVWYDGKRVPPNFERMFRFWNLRTYSG